MFKRWLITVLCVVMAVSLLAGCQGQNAGTGTDTSGETAQDGSAYVGQITAIDGDQVTLALGTLSQAQRPDMPDNAQQGDSGNPDAAPSGAAGEDGQQDDPPEMPSGAAPEDGSDTEGNGQPPANDGSDGGQPGNPPDGEAPGDGGPDGMGSQFTASGEEMTITVTDGTVITPAGAADGETGSLSDLQVGDIITVTLSGDAAAAITVEPAGPPGGQGGGPGSGGQDGSDSMDLTGATTVNGTSETFTGETYDSSSDDENTILVTNGGVLELTDATLTKSGGSSSADSSNFYGLNAILAVQAGSTATVGNTTLSSSGEGANALFATGEGAVITVSNVRIQTTGNSSRGLDATYGGVINATNVDITTQGAHCAPIATDRGEGTITVNGGTLSASGDGSPNIYSTGNITVTGVTGTATGSQIAVVEGKNSITLGDCALTGAGSNGIMLYQSTSGDAAEGTARFIATGCTLTTTSTGPMFYITNTEAEATLTNSTLNFTGGILVNVAGNDTNNWGTPDENGGSFTLTGVNQVLLGDVTCDSISAFTLLLTQGATFTGAVDTDNAAKETSVSLDSTSVWNVTADSYVTAITNALTGCSNIVSNGHTVYYDAGNTANAWLNGATITLAGGGTLTPAK